MELESISVANTIEKAVHFLNYEAATTTNFYNNYYVNREDSPIYSLKNSIIQSSNPIKILFSGNRGSGKTTELYNLKNQLEKQNFVVVFVAAIEDMNVADLYYTDILLGLIKKSIELLSLLPTKIDKKLKKQLEKQLMQLAGELVIEESFEKKGGIGLSIPNIKGFTDWIDGFFKREKTTRETIRTRADSLVTEILKTFNTLVLSIEKNLDKKIVVIVDDLEKVTDEGRISEILLAHSNAIGGLSCHIVLTVPPSLLYSPNFIPVTHTYGTTYFLPPFQLRNKDGSENQGQIDSMKNVITKRVSEDLISLNLLQIAAIRSGGLITDFIRMLKISLNNASKLKSLKLNSSFLDESFMDLVNDYNRIIDTLITGHEQEYYQILKNIHKNKDDYKTVLFRNLLFYLFVLEYNSGGSSWYDLHPAVEQVLLKRKIVTSE